MKPSLQWLRHLSQFTVFSLIFILPALSYYRSQLKEQDFQIMLKEEKSKTSSDSVLKFIDRNIKITQNEEGESIGAATEIEKTQEHLSSYQGNHWAMKIFNISIIDPLAAVESSLSSRGVYLPILLGITIPVLLTMIFGRFFCSWLCPAGLLFDISDKFRNLLKTMGFQLKNIALWKHQNILILCIGLIVSFVLSAPVLISFYPPAILARDIHHAVYNYFEYKSIFIMLSVSFSFFTIFFLLEIFISRRLWCRHLCPGGALYSLLGSFRLLRVQLIKSNCTDCGNCVKACPMNLSPMKGQIGIQCDNCQLCVKSCNDEALKLTISTKDIFFENNKAS